MEALVGGGVGDAPLVEDAGDGGFAVPFGKEGKDLLHHLSRFLVNEEASSVLRVLPIAVEGKGANVEPVLSPAVQNAFDALRHILQIPLVDQAVDLSGLFVALVAGVGVVRQPHKADAPAGEESVQIGLHQFQLPGKAGLAFAQDDIKATLFGVGNEPPEGGPVPVRAGVVVVAVNIIDRPALAFGILKEHGLLVLDADALVAPAGLIPVLLGEAAIEGRLHWPRRRISSAHSRVKRSLSGSLP